MANIGHGERRSPQKAFAIASQAVFAKRIFNDIIGLFGTNTGTIKNLEIASGKINAEIKNTNGEVSVGTIVAVNAGIIENCVNRAGAEAKSSSRTSAATVNVGGIVGADVTGQAEVMTSDRFASDEVAYKLGAAWGQIIGTDANSILGRMKVYLEKDTDEL